MQQVELPSDYQKFIHQSRYARWKEDEGRRETWEETVSRYFDFMSDHLIDNFNYEIPDSIRERIENRILNLDIMPSMRALMTAGVALERCNVAGYNCSYLPVDNLRSFDECLYILMCGTGVGFSVETKYTAQLPIVNEALHDSDTVVVVSDSKEGWAKGYKELISLLYSGQIPKWDLSRLRPAGARLKTFGGRSSGPEPLDDLFRFTVDIFKKSAGRRLKSIECHDIMCKIGSVVVVGGVRRSALISLSDLEDQEMSLAKSGEWWNDEGQRALANNSVCYQDTPPVGIFMREWLNLYNSKSGERGIFSRDASVRQAEKNGRRDSRYEFGTNPCSEIILRPHQFCNLTEVVVRADDDIERLAKKVEDATILGTIQSTLTEFKYLRKVWQNNTEEERLLGVSLTGIMDNSITNGNRIHLPRILMQLRDTAVATNKKWAKILGIPPSTAITCVKPSGTVSQLVDSSSGIHARHSAYYIRTVRGDNKDPLTQFMIDQGIPNEPCVFKGDTTTVFSFPVKSPDDALTRHDMSAIEQLKIWLDYQRHWCEHKPSVTVTVRDEEWMEVGAFVYEHFDEMSGVSFLPHSEHTYQQAPYQDCTKDVYDKLSSEFGHIDWVKLQDYEKEDTTNSSQTFACSGDSCEIVDIGG